MKTVDILLCCCLLGELQCWKVSKKHHLCPFSLLHQPCLAYLWLCTSPFGTLSCDYGWCTCNCLSELSHQDNPVTIDWQLRERNHYLGGNSKNWKQKSKWLQRFSSKFSTESLISSACCSIPLSTTCKSLCSCTIVSPKQLQRLTHSYNHVTNQAVWLPPHTRLEKSRGTLQAEMTPESSTRQSAMTDCHTLNLDTWKCSIAWTNGPFFCVCSIFSAL